MRGLTIEIVLLVFLVLLNGFFSLSEIALLSVKKSKLKRLAKSGSKQAEQALFLTRRSSEMLSTIQIGITTIGIFAGAFGGATIAEHLELFLTKFSVTAEYSGPISVVIVVVIITFLSLVIGELVPKQLALSHPERLSLRVAGLIAFIMKLTAPLVKVLSASTTGVLRLLRVKPMSEQVITEEEITLLIAEGAESGIFERSEQRMVESIFYLGNRPIRDFMTPRDEVIWLDINDPITEIRRKISGSDRSVFPVCEGDIDNNIGAIEVKDILNHLFDGNADSIDLKSLIQPVIRIDADVPSLVAIDRLKRSSISIVLITDKETKKIVGIISFHDILEAIVGEFKTV